VSLEPVIAAAARLVEAAADAAPAAELLGAALAPALTAARARPRWPVARLPLLVARAYGADDQRASLLAAACVLFFAAADVIDDAQDHDLGPAFPEDWPQAINAGLALTYLAQEAALEAALPTGRAAVGLAFARAGLAMSLGQRRDLAQRGDPGQGIREADYLACLHGKAGGSFALFAGLGALAQGQPAEPLEGYGRGLGMAMQLASDLADALAEDGRDRPNRQLTLPVIRAWEKLAPGDRPLLLASWHGKPDAPPLGFLIERSGARSSCEARLAALRTEAELALEGAELPDGLAGELGAIAQGVDARGPGPFA
jgi:geranylgeranyl pyrophosphate synthase